MEGNRVAKKEGGSALPWIVAGVLIAVLAGGYLGLCALAQSRDTILPNVSVAGVNVSDMTAAQAKTAVEAALRREGSDITLTLRYEDTSSQMNAGDMAMDAGQSVQEAYQLGRENFFTSGAKLLSHMLGASEDVPVSIPEDDPALGELIDEMSRAVAGKDADPGYELRGDRLFMTKGAPVLTVDWEKVRTDVERELQQVLTQRLTQGSAQKDVTVQIEAAKSEVEEPDFQAIHDALATEAKDAQLDPVTSEISDHQTGLDFDVNALKSAYQSAKGGETFSIPVTVIQPKVTRQDLEVKLFQDVLADVTTNISGTAARRSNVRLAAQACNGVILQPGEVFSYNDTTGQRTTAKGYRAAPAYVNGDTVDEVGGGVCQTSSTIYYAVLHTTLEVVERRPHRYAVTYVPDGMDATVSYGGIDFKFKNSSDYPLKIVTSTYTESGKDKLNVKLYGTNADGRTAKPTSNVFNVVAPTVQYVPDSSVPVGELVKDTKQNAYRGKSSQTYRTIYDADGKQLERQDMGVSVYRMRPTIYRYNPLSGDPTGGTAVQPNVPVQPDLPVQPNIPTQPVDPGVTTPVIPDPGITTPVVPDPGTTTPVPPDPGAADPVAPDPGTTTPAVPDPGTAAPVDPGPGTV